MQHAWPLALFSILAPAALAAGAKADPVAKVVELLQRLGDKIGQEGEAEARSFSAYTNWCSTAVKNTDFELKTATAQKTKLEARIGELTSDAALSNAKIQELAAAVSASTSELANSTRIREQERSEFVAGEEELLTVIDTLTRAGDALDQELKKNPAVLAQLDNPDVAMMLQSLEMVVAASALSVRDPQALLSLAHSGRAPTADELEPAATSANLVEVLQDLRKRADTQLQELRKAERNTKHDYAMLRKALESRAKADAKDLEQEKSARAAAEQAKAVAQGELEVASRELAGAERELAATRASCLQVAADHEATVAARAEELHVIGQAIGTLLAKTSGAVQQAYSFLQVSVSDRQPGDRSRLQAGPAAAQVIGTVRRLAKQHGSPALAQLASRIEAAVRYGSAGGEDPLAKVKGLVRDLIEQLQQEAEAEQTEKAYCDAEMSKTEAKRGQMDDRTSQLTASLDQAVAQSAALNRQVAELQRELASVAREQEEIGAIRQQAHGNYVTAKGDLQEGLAAIRQALNVLREYYANAEPALIEDDTHFSSMMQPEPQRHSKASGPGGSIIGLLEMIESDFANNLAKEEAEEVDAQSAYERVTQENRVATATKERDAKYKLQESKSLEKTITEMSSDKESVGTELAAVLEYAGKLRERCVAKPETFEDRRARREAEISGLEEALETLRSPEPSLVQRRLRGEGGAISPGV